MSRYTIDTVASGLHHHTKGPMQTSNLNRLVRNMGLLSALIALSGGCAGKDSTVNGSGGSIAAQGGATGLGGTSSHAGGTQAIGGSSSGPLRWYTTCGYPVCRVPALDAGVVDAGPPCPAIGASCSTQGATCGTPSDNNCGSILICASQDPKGGIGGCPISSKNYKNGIEYLGDAELQKLHAEALGIRLATYKYNNQVDDSGPTHLGFLIEDNPQSAAVDSMHNRVNMYGYVSMVVAGMQVQEKEIAELRKELEAARRDASMCRKPHK